MPILNRANFDYWYIPALCAGYTAVWKPSAALSPYSMHLKLRVA